MNNEQFIFGIFIGFITICVLAFFLNRFCNYASKVDEEFWESMRDSCILEEKRKIEEETYQFLEPKC